MNKSNTIINLDRAVIKKGGLKKFIELSWHEIEPGKPFMSGWHIDAICEHLEAITVLSRLFSISGLTQG
jgi:hypothetical protein